MGFEECLVWVEVWQKLRECFPDAELKLGYESEVFTPIGICLKVVCVDGLDQNGIDEFDEWYWETFDRGFAPVVYFTERG